MNESNAMTSSVPVFTDSVAVPADGPTCDTFDIRIDRDGVWYYHGSPIGRHEMVCLFASVLHRAEDGSYWLITPAESGRIDVDDVPFIGVELYVSKGGGQQSISIRTNVDEIVAIDEDHPLRVETDPLSGEPSPYVTVRSGLEAKLTRSVFYELVELGAEEETPCGKMYGVRSGGQFFPIGRLDED